VKESDTSSKLKKAIPKRFTKKRTKFFRFKTTQSNKEKSPTLVSSQWVKQNYSKLKIFDCSWYMHDPAQPRYARKEFVAKRLKNAKFFNLDEVSDPFTTLPHMIPSAEHFTKQMKSLGLNRDDHVLVYDCSGIYFASARAWWMFKLFGHEKVSILDGGLKDQFEPDLIESGSPNLSKQGSFKASEPNKDLIKNLDDILKNNKSKESLVIDARSEGRFKGKDPEPRPNLFGGHIPNSKNLFYKKVLNEDGTFKSKEQLEKIFNNVGVVKDTPVITSCGSGVSAAVVLVTLDLVGHKNYSIYDGSWSEYGQIDKQLPYEKD